jgi:hypothetical protein
LIAKEIFNQAANGVSVLAVKKITEKANALGFGSTSSNSDNNNFMI